MTSGDELNEKLQALWKKSLPLMLRRLEAISRAHEAMSEGKLTDAMRTQAVEEAHKLAGSLGVFGLHQGSESALHIERIFSSTDNVAHERAALGEHLARLTRDIRNR